jgi:hypothetical protein
MSDVHICKLPRVDDVKVGDSFYCVDCGSLWCAKQSPLDGYPPFWARYVDAVETVKFLRERYVMTGRMIMLYGLLNDSCTCGVDGDFHKPECITHKIRAIINYDPDKEQRTSDL